VIKTFADKSTKEFWDTGKSQGMPPANLRNAAKKKLAMLHAAGRLEDLLVPPGNRLEELRRDRKANTSFGSTINSACASYGVTAMPSVWR